MISLATMIGRWKAKSVIINKRSMRPGYAGIENQLFFQPNSSMLFGDAKKNVDALVAKLKEAVTP